MGQISIIDPEWFFIRGCLEMPISGSGDLFLWGLWVAVREEVFDEMSACWELAGREKLRGPFKGRLGNSLSVYQETLNLKVQILSPLGSDHCLSSRKMITRSRLSRGLELLAKGLGSWPGSFCISSALVYPKPSDSLGFPMASTDKARFPQLLHSNRS
jgi:hypothetical protein